MEGYEDVEDVEGYGMEAGDGRRKAEDEGRETEDGSDETNGDVR